MTSAPPTPAPAFSAAQLAAGLGISKRVVLKVLADSFSSEQVIQGNTVRVWRVDALPESYRAELRERAARAGCRGIEQYLSASDASWTAPIPFHAAAEYYQVRAQKLQTALALVLRRQHDATREELLTLGLRDYRAAFGDDVTPEHFWRLFDRTTRRAGPSPNWQDVNLYLDDNAARRTEVQTPAPILSECGPLSAAVAGVGDRREPIEAEASLLFLNSFRWFEERVSAGRPRLAVRRLLLDFLFAQVPGLAPNPNALRAKWDLKLKNWIANGRNTTALDDGRRALKGVSDAPAFLPADVETIVWHSAFNCAGKIAQAVRELVSMGDESGLSPSMLNYLAAPSRKSDVPRRLAEVIAPQVRMVRPYVLGGQHVDDARAWLKRDWSRVKPYQCFCADDFTFPIYFWIANADGTFTLTRGQCLVFIDARTLRVLEHSLQPDRNYNSRVIRTLMTRVGENWAWPDVFLFEMGIWKDSKLIHGSTALPWGEAEYGLERLGTRFIHAIRARSKPVERVGGLLQDRMEKLPGYCGRDERRDCPELTRRNKLLAERGRDPSELFYSLAQWDEQLHRLIEDYNATPQGGDILRGLSPDQALEQLRDPKDEPRKFGPESRYLLAHHKSDKRVTVNGITLRFGKQAYVYRDAQTSELQHQIVRCWWNPETPEYLTITDMDDKHPRCIPLAGAVDPLNVDDEYKAEAAKAEAHGAFGKTLYRTLKTKFDNAHRRTLIPASTAELGREMDRVQGDFQRTRKQAGQSRRIARDIGMQISPEAAARPESSDELHRLKEFLDDESPAPAKASGGKVYVLDAPPASKATLPQLQKQLFAIWNQLEALQPGLNRHSIIFKALCYNKAVPKMTREELGRCMKVFGAILRDKKKGIE